MALLHAIMQLMLASAGTAGADDMAARKTAGPRPATRRSGIITPNDYPMSALREGAQGVTQVRYLVSEDGRVLKCMIARSSGNAALDSTSCSLLQRRYRFNPAVGRRGRPSTQWMTEDVRWTLPTNTSLSPAGQVTPG